MQQRGLQSIKLTRGMLLMQYNDNIPAVFGFPRVIPHQRRGLQEEDRRTGGVHFSGSVELFLSFPPSLLSVLSVSFFIVSSQPCVYDFTPPVSAVFTISLSVRTRPERVTSLLHRPSNYKRNFGDITTEVVFTSMRAADW